MRAVNPATGQLIRSYEEATESEVETILAEASGAQKAWARSSFAERAVPVREAAAKLRAEATQLSRLMAQEMGKPLPQGRAEIEKCALVCEYYAENAARFLAPEPVATDARRSYVRFEPAGVVLGVMPWNFPFWQVFRFAAPALMAGNAALLKHASNVPGSALAIERLLHEAGIPRALFRTLMVGAARVPAIIHSPQVRAVTLTGSTPAGKAIAVAAASVLKKVVLELGGSDPYVILQDADLDAAADAAVTSRLINGGQSCIAAKRFIVVEPVLSDFSERVVERMRARRHGDPLADESVDLGPLARADLRDELHDQVLRSVRSGAQLLLGGTIPPGPGAYYPATVLGGVRRGMAAYHEETFGPVAAILPARDEEAALMMANDSPFGLGAAVFTRDLARGERIACERLEAGSCFVNDYVRSDPRLPFGGVKESGYGRELASFGIREFVNVKTIYLAG